jgi:IPT/TIG domain-containing protein
MRSFLSLLVFATSLSAAPVISSISPSTGTVVGGAHVTIRGSGFANPAVRFEGTPAASVRMIDSTTLDVVTPALLPSSYAIVISQNDGLTILQDAFVVDGDPAEGFDAILLPVFSPPVHGAFGSEFRTIVRATNKSTTDVLNLYLGAIGCDGPAPVGGAGDPLIFQPDGTTFQLPASCSRWPAGLVYVPRGQAASSSMNLRVLDVTRQATSQGTEIPIVRPERMTRNPIVLIGVPTDSRFRNTLRIYAARQVDEYVTVTVNGQSHLVHLTPGRNIFEPSYGTFGEFPAADGQTINVRIDPPVPPGGVSPSVPGTAIWAFITVTNDETQQITTISPD